MIFHVYSFYSFENDVRDKSHRMWFHSCCVALPFFLISSVFFDVIRWKIYLIEILNKLFSFLIY